jgi:anti-sigma-K factor RskA
MGSLSIHELTAAYALDALDPEEAREYERHLAECDRCRGELAELSEGAAALAFGVDAPAPPDALRERILDQVRNERANVVSLRPRWTRTAKVATALAVAAAVVLAISTASLLRSLDSERSARERADRAVAVLSDPDAQRVPLQGADGLLVTGMRGSALVIRDLAAAPSGKTYEAWVIDDGRPIPAGTFDGGSDTTVHRLDTPVSPGSQVAVTVERAGGVDAPTGKILLSAKVA